MNLSEIAQDSHAALKEVRLCTDQKGYYLSLIYKDVRFKDGRIVDIIFPKVRINIPKHFIPVIRQEQVTDDDKPTKKEIRLGDNWFPLERTDYIVFHENGGRTYIENEDLILINQTKKMTLDEAEKALNELYGCAVAITNVVEKQCVFCKHAKDFSPNNACKTCNEGEMNNFEPLPSCRGCKHYDLPGIEHPCVICEHFDHWEEE